MKLQSNTWTLIDFVKYKATATSPLILYYNWKQPTSPGTGQPHCDNANAPSKES